MKQIKWFWRKKKKRKTNLINKWYDAVGLNVESADIVIKGRKNNKMAAQKINAQETLSKPFDKLS